MFKFIQNKIKNILINLKVDKSKRYIKRFIYFFGEHNCFFKEFSFLKYNLTKKEILFINYLKRFYSYGDFNVEKRRIF